MHHIIDWPVLTSISRPKGKDAKALYVRLPVELQRPIDGGCCCAFCKAHPDKTPTWDTLGIPIPSSDHSYGATHTWTVHAPEAV